MSKSALQDCSYISSGKAAFDIVFVAITDRDVNVRKAASAAFQEGRGRFGDEFFPHGLKIMEMIDFYSVTNRSHCYRFLVSQISM